MMRNKLCFLLGFLLLTPIVGCNTSTKTGESAGESKTEKKKLTKSAPKTSPEKFELAEVDASTAVEGLEIGNIAPDITHPDSSGKEFSLSEYRGKVVMLDFWGHW